MDRELRIATRYRVELRYGGEVVVAESEELSRRGAFVRLETTDLPISAVVDLIIALPMAQPVTVRARVAHILGAAEARALGRSPGLGLEFLAQDEGGRHRLRTYFDSLVEETTPPPEELLHSIKLLVVDPSTPLLLRLTHALEGAPGFSVDTVRNGHDALAAIDALDPDVVLAALDMPLVDGIELLRRLRDNQRLGDPPVLVMADSGQDLRRLEAFRMGAVDVIEKPFTDEELAIRLRRAVLPGRRERSGHLRGSIRDISMGTVLSLLEFERKSGILTLQRQGSSVRLMVDAGRILDILGPTESLSARERLMLVLDWGDGHFEFTASHVSQDDRIGMSIQELLLEHARVVDEGSG